MINSIVKFFLQNRLVTFLFIVAIFVGGIIVSPFKWDTGFLPSHSVAVDALPDIGENQQIIFTEWEGRSPQDIEDQITYPLTTTLLGLPGVKDIRSSSMQGFSSIAVIFEDDVEFYWSRSRILEKLNSLPPNLIPADAKPTLGPDATALGQVFWYTLEGRDEKGNPAGGWDLHEIRSVQDFFVKYALNGVEGVSEVASIGGNVQEYQVDVNPVALRKYGISITDVSNVVGKSNKDIGAQTLEINQAEYLIRGLGYIKSIEDIELAVIKEINNVPIRVGQVAEVRLGPAAKRGALDKDGAEVVGGVVVSRFGANPMEVIQTLKEKVEEISPGLPTKVLADGSTSQLTIVPFYDRSELIFETLDTLNEALTLQLLITVLVIIVMVYNLRVSVVISSLLPLGVLMVFMGMKGFGIDANIVALSGIAIAIGTMVDLGIILSENVIKKIESRPEETLFNQVFEGAKEVSSAILTAVATTVISFLPVFTLQAAEGKLFGPLAYTKTFALIAALIVALFILPTLIYWFFDAKVRTRKMKLSFSVVILALGVVGLFNGIYIGSIALLLFGLVGALKEFNVVQPSNSYVALLWGHLELVFVVLGVVALLATYWMPLGSATAWLANFIFVSVLVGLILGFFLGIQYSYATILSWCLSNRKIFLAIPTLLVSFGLVIWFGFATLFGFVEKGFEKVNVNIKTNAIWSGLVHTFPGIGNEFMPALDEGSFLLMPTSMPHSGVSYNQNVIAQLDQLISNIPEVDMTVGKLGRAETPMDPAPISMFENVINYKKEYVVEDGKQLHFKTYKDGRFFTVEGDTLSNDALLEKGYTHADLVLDKKGKPFRNWRSKIKNAQDIWDEITKVAKIPGVTSAPKLQPIETRIVMLQTGMSAPMGIKVHGPDLNSIEAFGLSLESILKEIPSVKREAVFAERVVGKPYIHLDIDRYNLGRYGLTIDDVQSTIEMAIGGVAVTTTVEGRQRYAVRVRYPRALRDDPKELENILVMNSQGVHIPLSNVVEVSYVQGPQEIRSENTFLTSYVLFDKQEGFAETNTAIEVNNVIAQKIKEKVLEVPAGVTFEIAGNFENQVRAQKRFAFIIPVVLITVFMILYFQFRSIATSLMVFSSIALAFSGGFVLLWMYGQDWFLNFDVFNTSMRELFQVSPVNLSVAVWVGFIALFGLATDDGVLMATYLDQSFEESTVKNKEEVREKVIEGALKRIRPAVMTSATTLIALLPVLTSAGRGSDIMIPMAIPAFGGMIMTCITYYIVPTLYAIRKEKQLIKESTSNEE